MQVVGYRQTWKKINLKVNSSFIPQKNTQNLNNPKYSY